MFFPLLLGAAVVSAGPAPIARDSSSSAVSVSVTAPEDAGEPILRPFVSFSIELSSFPDFAGNLSQPNKFSNQLLDNLADLQGVKSYIRVGGSTQDLTLYDPNLKTGINGTYVSSVSSDYPAIVSIGPSFFESYATWPGAKFSFGFNLAENGTEGRKNLIETASLACKALKGKLAYWELGNEPDLFKTTTPGTKRPASWDESDYVAEWLSKTELIKRQMAKTCPELATDAEYKYIAPSFAGLTNSLDPVTTWQDGLGTDNDDIKLNSMHNYISGATSPGVTLQRTLMNHTQTVESVQQHVNLSNVLNEEDITTGIPYILGETNSLYNEGKPGLSNSFGAALWGVDFNLYCASQSIRRTHMHQGTNYRYVAWQPIQTNDTTIGTKAPYYGNVMVAAMLGSGDSPSSANVQVVNLPLQDENEAAYAAYIDGKISRIAVINLQEYNYTVSDSSASRPSVTYEFLLSDVSSKSLSVQRLMANGSNAISGITWDGWSYNYELKGGAPVRLDNVTTGETVSVDSKGLVQVKVPWSSGVILNV